jgi:hypothetical protein
LSTAGIQHAGHLYSRHLFEQLSGQMRSTAKAGRTVEQLIWLLFGEHNKSFHISDIKIRMNNEDVGNRAHEHNWRHVAFDIGPLARHHYRVDRNRYRGKQQRVTILGATRDIIGGYHAAGAGTIFHNNRLLEQLCKLVADDPGGNVTTRTGGESEDQVDRACRVIVVHRCGRLCDKQESSDKDGKEFHGFFAGFSTLRTGVSGIKPSRRRFMVSSPLSAHCPSTARRA